MNGANEECNILNGCLSELDTVNNYFYLGNNMNGRGKSELAVTQKIVLSMALKGPYALALRPASWWGCYPFRVQI